MSARWDPPPLDASVRNRFRAQPRRDTSIEMAIRRRIHSLGYRYRVDFRPERSLRCRGDLVFTRAKVVVFVDGCFWHRCPEHGTSPTNNAEWWRQKLDANVARDRRNDAALRGLGWTVVRVWEHEAAKDAVGTIVKAVDGARTLES